MKIVHVVPTVSQEADGVADVARNLCQSMAASNIDVRLAALDWKPLIIQPTYWKTFPIGLGPRRLGISPQMRRWLQAEAKSNSVDVIHNHGLWMMPNVYAGNACLKSSAHLVFSPHGAMSTWALGRSKLIKDIFWKFFQEPAMQATACFHATAVSEFEDIRNRGFRQPVCIIPCGVHVQPLEQTPHTLRRQLLFLARIHPIKGVENLLHAWQVVECNFPDWDLHIVGPDNDGYLLEIQELVEKLRLKRVIFRGPLYGDDKLQAYRDASLYVLPTHSENFGITVAEAMSAGTPVIVTKGAPWPGVATNGAGWWIEIGVEPLITCLESALSSSPQRLMAMGKAGHDWMKRDFAWTTISDKFFQTYQWLTSGGKVPPWVKLD